MKQNKFDLVMDYIDENIQLDTEEIKKGIYCLIGVNSNTFGKLFSEMTGDTLGAYIRKRRLYFATEELQNKPEIPICDVALRYGYSDQTSFTRAVTTAFGYAPNELRKKRCTNIPNNRYRYKYFAVEADGDRFTQMLRELEQWGSVAGAGADYLMYITEGQAEYGFSVDECCAIIDLAEMLRLPPELVMSACYELVTDRAYRAEGGPEEEAESAASLGLSTLEELRQLCKYYNCKHYELSGYMVEEYRASSCNEVKE